MTLAVPQDDNDRDLKRGWFVDQRRALEQASAGPAHVEIGAPSSARNVDSAEHADDDHDAANTRGGHVDACRWLASSADCRCSRFNARTMMSVRGDVEAVALHRGPDDGAAEDSASGHVHLTLPVRSSSDHSEPRLAFDPTNRRSPIDRRLAELSRPGDAPTGCHPSERDAHDATGLVAT